MPAKLTNAARRLRPISGNSRPERGMRDLRCAKTARVAVCMAIAMFEAHGRPMTPKR